MAEVPPSLQERLRRARRRRFVGRAGEVEVFRAALSDPDGARVLFLHGPGGVGKSTVLDAMSEVAAGAGAEPVRVDARLVAPTPAGVLDAVGRTALSDRRRPVLLLDTYERLAAVDGWVRAELLAALPGNAVVVIAGRQPPSPGWLADPAWRELLRVISLRNLAPADTRAYLAVEQVPEPLHDRLVALSHGHPLTLSLLVDALARRGADAVPRSLAEAPDLVRALLEHVVDAAPSPRHRAALEVCAHVRFTTEDLLRAVLGGEDSGELFGWLRGLSFVEEGPFGLFPHDLARDVLDADLRWRDRAGYADLHRRVRAELLSRVDGPGDPADRRRRVADAVFVARGHPPMEVYFAQPNAGPEQIDRVRPADRAPILAMTQRHQGPEQAELVDFWLDRQPDGFRVFRGAAGEPIGYGARLALHEATATDLAADPGAMSMWEYARRHGPPRPGEQVLAWRFFVDRDHYHAPSASLGLTAVWNLEEILTQRRWSWDFLGTYEDPLRWAAVMDYLDFGRAEEADFTVGGRRYVVFAHDWRRVGLVEWLDLTAQRELGAPAGPAHPHTPELVLSQPEFTEAVRDALRDLRSPQRLAANPLLRSRLVRQRADGRPPADVLAEQVAEAAAALRTDPRERGLYDVVDGTFLRPAPTQERAAEVLHLSFSTYRRHRDRAVARIVEWLWRREVYGDDA